VREILRKARSGFRQKAPARKEPALTPSKRLKLSLAGPMALHAPSVWERGRGRVKATNRNVGSLFLLYSADRLECSILLGCQNSSLLEGLDRPYAPL
jgi:hypothetical protein